MSARIALCGLAAALLAAWPARAQQERFDNRAQIVAEEAWRVLRERRVLDLSGKWIGRVEDVRAREGDGQAIASLRLRPRYRSRRVEVPVRLFVDRGGKLVVAGTLDAILAAPPRPR